MDIPRREELRQERRKAAEQQLLQAEAAFDRADARFKAAMDNADAPDALRRSTLNGRKRAAKAVARAEENLRIVIRAWL